MRVIITPEYARHLLEYNTHNRVCTKTNIKKLAEEMKHNNWCYNGETIKLGKTVANYNGLPLGQLLDGQTRLKACIMAGRDFETELITELDYDVFTTIDTGRTRSFKDILTINGIMHAAQKASTTTELYYWISAEYTKGCRHRNRLPDRKKYTFYTNNISIIDEAVDHCLKFKSAKSPIAPGKLCLSFIILNSINPEKCKEFLDKIVFGYDLERNSPILALRNTILRLNPEIFLFHYHVMDLIFKTWNMFIQNQTTSNLRLRRNFEKVTIPIGYRGLPVQNIR
jgi:hypothetical protein